jgi:hypothetical protein
MRAAHSGAGPFCTRQGRAELERLGLVSDLLLLVTVFAVTFIAELPDKSLFASLVQHRVDPSGVSWSGWRVAEVEPGGAVQDIFWGTERQAGGEDVVLVAFVAVGEQGETPQLGVAGVLEPT